MIVKALSRKSNDGQLVGYVLRYLEKDERKLIGDTHDLGKEKILIRHNVRSRSINGIIKEFQQNEAFRLVRRKDSVKLFHYVLGISSQDKQHVTKAMLKDLGRRFIELRGENNLYCGAAHFNTDSIHMHLIVSGTQLNGRSSRLSRQQLQTLKLSLDRYQEKSYPNLVHSLPQHGRKNNRESLKFFVTQNHQNKKETLIKCIEGAHREARSQEHFIALLKAKGHECYFRNDQLQGVLYEGKTKYRFSRLGFDKSNLNLIQHESSFETGLRHLRDIRTRGREFTKIERPIYQNTVLSKEVSLEEEGKLTELSQLREKRDTTRELEVPTDIGSTDSFGEGKLSIGKTKEYKSNPCSPSLER